MITSLVGSNAFLVQNKKNNIKNVYIAEYDDMGLEYIDGQEAAYERITEAVQSLPFLAAKKLVILQDPGANKQFLENTETLFSDIPEVTDVVIIESKPDKRTSYYKWLKKNTDFYECVELDARGLGKWIVEFAKDLGNDISTQDALYLVDRVGANQQLLSHEIEKLSLGGKKITRATIDMLTEKMPQSKIFDLLDVAFAGRTEEALRLYKEQRQARVEPQEILAMIGWQLRQIAVVKTAGDKHDVVSEAKMSPYSVSKTKKIAHSITFSHLKQLVGAIVDLDVSSKSQPIDLDDALQTYILKIA
jgi:DNA polymerase III delta subunit